MQAQEAVRLFDYLYWIRDRVLASAAELSAEQFRATETSTTRDLRSTLVHELDVEWSWRERLCSSAALASEDEGELNPADYETLEALRQHWRRDETEMRAWLAGLTDADLTKPPAAEQAKLPLADYLMHVVGHGIEEFTEAALLLTKAGHSPGQIEFLEYADPRPPRTAVGN